MLRVCAGVSNVRLRTTTLKWCAWDCVSVHTYRSDCHSPIGDSKMMFLLLPLVCVTSPSRPELVYCIFFRTCAGTSDDIDHGDCRHDCDDEESHQAEFFENDPVHDDPMTTVLHRDLQMDYPSLLFSTVHFVCIQRVVRSLRCCCLRIFLDSSFHLLLCQIIPCRTACILVRECACDIARPRDSAPAIVHLL